MQLQRMQRRPTLCPSTAAAILTALVLVVLVQHGLGNLPDRREYERTRMMHVAVNAAQLGIPAPRSIPQSTGKPSLVPPSVCQHTIHRGA